MAKKDLPVPIGEGLHRPADLLSLLRPVQAVRRVGRVREFQEVLLQRQGLSRLTELALPFIEKAGINVSGVDRARLEGIIGLEQEKYKLLTEIPDLIRFFFEEPVFEQEAIDKVFSKPEAKQVLEGMIQVYGNLTDFTETNLETAARAYAKENAIDLVFVAPDDPLAAGLVDMLEAEGVKAFGPRKNAARSCRARRFRRGKLSRGGLLQNA